MEHYYENIHGFFTFHELYSEMVKKFPSGSKFVEVGCWLGKSAVYLGVEIVNSGKDIKLDCIDIWAIMDDPILHQEEPIKNGTLYKDFLKNIEPLRKVIKAIRMDSAEASNNYEDESLDFVYIDADHSYEAFKKDLQHWYPKVKRGGVFAGHDANFFPIIENLEIFFPNKDFEVRPCQSWIHFKN